MLCRCSALIVFAALALALDLTRAQDALVLSSADVGVHKCEFQGTVGGRRVRLYVFLTACIRPSGSADPQGGQHQSEGGSSPNFYITGNTFMLLDGEPCTTTQLQQPLDALVWAAGLLGVGQSSISSRSNRRKALAQGGGDSGSNDRADKYDAVHEPDAALVVEATRVLVAGSQGALTLRSRLTGTDHRLRVAVHEPHKWRNNPSLRREPGRVTGALVLTPQELQAVARGSSSSRGGGGGGSSSSSSSSSSSNDNTGAADEPALFELRAAGMEGVCSYAPTRGRRPPPPAAAGPIDLTSRVTIDGGAAASGARQEQSASGGAATGAGAPTCAWLDPERQMYDAAVLDSWRAEQRASAALAAAKKRNSKDRSGGAVARARAPPLAGVGARPPAYVVVSPFFGLAPRDFVTLLLRHVEYHAQLGVGRHLVYIEEGEVELAADPRVAALVAAGRLELVRWTELPAFSLPGAAAETAKEEAGAAGGDSAGGGAGQSPGRHPYASQILTYNHALLALWHEAAVVAVLDLDEYVVTSRPQRLEAALRACSPRGRFPPGALWVPRRSLLCTDCWGQAAAPAADAATAGGVAGPEAGGGVFKANTGFTDGQLRNATLAAAAASLERRLWLAAASGQEAVEAGGSRARKGIDRGGGSGGKDDSGGGGGTQVHPLASYHHWFLGWHHKSIMYSHLVTYFGVHLAYIEEQGAGQGPNEGGDNPHTICRLGCMWVGHLETQLGPRVRSPLEALAQYNSKGDAEKRTAGGGGGGGKKQKVTAVEGRYMWALQRWLGRPSL
ncbi:hypothetical protein HYH02_013101 [Chlamydomonas schloesseri]|uniref:Glycosyltransferase family 92 protein n=1 Tax=Chlamydomonas schloesseri TaxID=2026947 RepID=A0A835SUE4_9CHLO|nr:hypothetical protein HYH02_013101 [Chlamydomonas schloesseri]|eukprot:KAG2432031.1 hypothetical protein HYH02_013101 [Chlamydomonas schloesseri]